MAFARTTIMRKISTARSDALYQAAGTTILSRFIPRCRAFRAFGGQL
jgi:hypothetical protein